MADQTIVPGTKAGVDNERGGRMFAMIGHMLAADRRLFLSLPATDRRLFRVGCSAKVGENRGGITQLWHRATGVSYLAHRRADRIACVCVCHGHGIVALAGKKICKGSFACFFGNAIPMRYCAVDLHGVAVRIWRVEHGACDTD